jgi:hypothetical protein
MKKWLKHLNSTPFGFMPAGPRLAATEAMLRVCFFPLPQGGRRDEWAGADRTNDPIQPVRAVIINRSRPDDRALGCNRLFVFEYFYP